MKKKLFAQNILGVAALAAILGTASPAIAADGEKPLTMHRAETPQSVVIKAEDLPQVLEMARNAGVSVAVDDAYEFNTGVSLRISFSHQGVEIYSPDHTN